MIRLRDLMCAVLISGCCLVGASQAGVERTWTGVENNDWLNANNWSLVGGSFPGGDIRTVLFGRPMLDGFIRAGSPLMIIDGESVIVSGFGTSVRADIGDFLVVEVGNAFGSGTLTVEQHASFLMNPRIEAGAVYTPATLYVGRDGVGILNVRDSGSTLHSYVGTMNVGIGYFSQGTVNVSGGGKIEMSQINVGSSNSLGQIFVTGAGSKVASTYGMVLGTYGTAMVEVGSGASIEAKGAESLTIGQEVGSYGTLTLRGTGTSGGMAVGESGYGEVRVLDGGLAKILGGQDMELGVTETGSGKVVVQGAGSVLDVQPGILRVGVLGKGELEVLDGGLAFTDEMIVAPTVLGNGPSSVKVSGTDSVVDCYQRIRFYSGSLEISDGGLLENTFYGVGSGGQDYLGGPGDGRMASALVTGAKSEWDGGYKARLTVSAGLNPAELVIQQGGTVQYDSLLIGAESYSDGLVSVEGAGSKLWVKGQNADESVAGGAGTVVGYQGAGELLIGAKAKVHSFWGGVQIAPVAGAVGRVDLQGLSTWDIGGDLHIGGYQGGNGGQGTIGLDSKAQVSVSGDMKVWQQGVLALRTGAKMTINGETLTFANQAKYSADPGSVIVFFGTNLQIESTNSGDVDGLADTTLMFAGGPRVVDRVEVAGAERGPEWDGFHNNFAIGRIVVGTPGEPSHLELSDLVNNGSGGVETLYIRELVLHPGSTVNLGGHNLRVLELTDLGSGIIAEGEGRMDHLGAIRAIDVDETRLTFERGEGNTGTLHVGELVSVRLASDMQERVLPAVDIDLSAAWVYNKRDMAAGLVRFDNGRATLIGDNGEAILLDAGFGELVLTEDGDGGLVGQAVLDVDDTAWANAFAMDYSGQIELQITIAHTGGVEEFLDGFGGQTVMGMTTVLEPVLGDTNYDRIVDMADYDNLVAQLGGTPGVYSADFNEDGFVGLADFAILRSNYGFGVVSAQAPELGATTPEPATLTLLALGGLAVLRRRQRV